MNFGEAIALLNAGELLQRGGWNGKGLFVFRQVPAIIGIDIVPKMQSLPPKVKEEFVNRYQNDPILNDILYRNQLAIVDQSNNISGWAPSVSDALANDWQLYKK